IPLVAELAGEAVELLALERRAETRPEPCRDPRRLEVEPAQETRERRLFLQVDAERGELCDRAAVREDARLSKRLPRAGEARLALQDRRRLALLHDAPRDPLRKEAGVCGVGSEEEAWLGAGG